MIQKIKLTPDVKEQCDQIFSKLITSVGVCRRCGATEQLTCAHFCPRRFNRTRTDLNNACCLCLRCHRRLTDHPREHDAFVVSLIGEAAYDSLKLKAQAVYKMDWNEELKRLKSIDSIDGMIYT